jgi:hypothetical protein
MSGGVGHGRFDSMGGEQAKGRAPGCDGFKPNRLHGQHCLHVCVMCVSNYVCTMCNVCCIGVCVCVCVGVRCV